MRILEGETIYSATDLVGFAACEHLTQLELSAARGERKRPQRHDPLLEILTRKGDEHEADVLGALPHGADEIVRVNADTSGRAGLETAAAETIAAMAQGARVIYQATFLHDGWVGHADFLERVETPSQFGAWSYEVADAKLSRSVKAAALVQMCEYSEHVTRVQGVVPQRMHVITGDGERHTFRLADYAAYHRSLKARFEATSTAGPVETYPEPIEHCGICRWWAECKDRRRTDDHLSLVAWIRRDQTKRLIDAGISTRRALAAGPDELPGASVAPSAYKKLRLQAALQVKGEGQIPPLYELLAPEEVDDDAGPRGFAALPEPSPGDLFLDLEGDPYALDGGLEYLFGLVEVVDGERRYHEFWAHTRSEERKAFEAAVDLITERRTQHPDMHVYHYAAYEQTAFKRLMGTHGTREDEIDTFLRSEVFVDLYRVFRQAVRVSTESYSLKEIEKLYFTRPAGEVMDAGSSIITYERYLVDGDVKLLKEIALYNRDDCESLVDLQIWIEARRIDAEATYGTIERPRTPDASIPDPELDALAILAAQLLVDVPDDTAERTNDEQGRYLLAHLLDWHRREAKPEWWRYFDRCLNDTAEFIDDSECIGGLELVEIVGPDKQSTVYRMRFDPQEHKFSAGSKPVDPADGKEAGVILAIDEGGVLEFKRGKRRDSHPLPRALIPSKPLPTSAQRAAIVDVAEWVANHNIAEPGPYQATRDLLLRQAPRFPGAVPGAALRLPDEEALDAATRLALALDGGCLAIQGPPGSGKTYTGARMIVALLKAGKRVGIAATTHSAIGNLLSDVAEAAHEASLTFRGMQKAEDAQATVAPGIETVSDASDIETALADGTIHLAAGTTWLWARSGLRDSVDVLVIDEAGQMSLADVTAAGTAACNLVLLGDPQQLAQPSKGSHPDGAEASALQHLLDNDDTIPDDRGIFLDVTYRMHPTVCRYISEIAYEDRLKSAPARELQSVDGAAGVWFVPVIHDGDSTRSDAEAQTVADLVQELVGTPWTDHHGSTRPLALQDVIIIAPYNLHVAAIRSRVPAGAHVGTVDKFQGREGAVAIYSTASSSAAEAPRGMDFLYDLHRLNVAVSRAHAHAFIVASPELLRALCRTPKQLHLANALCRFVEYANSAQTAMINQQ